MLQVINFWFYVLMKELNYCDYMKLWVYDINYKNNANYDWTILESMNYDWVSV